MEKIENIYHCCLQKTASQWVKNILTDKLVSEKTHYQVMVPEKDYITDKRFLAELDNAFPSNTIISPLYVTYEQFARLPKPKNYRAIWVMRDIRDVIVSQFFSITYSHKVINESHMKTREKLQKMAVEDSFQYFLDNVYKIDDSDFSFYHALRSWNQCADDNVMLCKYEDLTGEQQTVHWRGVFDFLGLPIEDKVLSKLLDHYSFQKITGRAQGEENVNAHLRKGRPGDWKNYFSEQHKHIIKKHAGDILIAAGYEKNTDW